MACTCCFILYFMDCHSCISEPLICTCYEAEHTLTVRVSPDCTSCCCLRLPLSHLVSKSCDRNHYRMHSAFLCVACALICSMPCMARVPKQNRRVQSPSCDWNLDELIPESYNKLKAPKNATKECDINITLNITEILNVNEADEVR